MVSMSRDLARDHICTQLREAAEERVARRVKLARDVYDAEIAVRRARQALAEARVS